MAPTCTCRPGGSIFQRRCGPRRLISVLLSPMDIAARKPSHEGTAARAPRRIRGRSAASSDRIAENFLRSVLFPHAPPSRPISPSARSRSGSPLIEALRARGLRNRRCPGRRQGQAARLSSLEEGAKLVPGVLGLSQPAPDWAEAIPDISPFPLLAFDSDGNRWVMAPVSMTGRSPAYARATSPRGWLCFAGQEVAAVPHHDGDEKLDGGGDRRRARVGLKGRAAGSFHRRCHRQARTRDVRRAAAACASGSPSTSVIATARTQPALRHTRPSPTTFSPRASTFLTRAIMARSEGDPFLSSTAKIASCAR